MKTKPTPTVAGLAFTSIELLVLVAIIAILAALLLPVLARAGQRAQRITCTNNFKLLGAALRMYTDDNRDAFAFNNWDGGMAYGYHDTNVQGWLYAITNGSIPDVGPGGAYQNNEQVAYNTGLWFQYMSDPKRYLCPVDIKSATWATPVPPGVRNANVRNNRMSSYVMNGASCDFGDPAVKYESGQFIKTTAAWSSMCYITWEPDENRLGLGDPGAFAFNDGANYPRVSNGEGVGGLHSKNGGNILSISGAVTYITVKQFDADSLAAATSAAPGPGGRTFLWWAPDDLNGGGP